MICIHSLEKFKSSKGEKGKEQNFTTSERNMTKDKSVNNPRDSKNNNLVKDIKNDEKEPENIFEGSVLPKLFWRWLFSKQKHTWECTWKKT